MKIYAPNSTYSGMSAGVQFADGVGETDNEASIAYFGRAGYGIGERHPAAPERQEPFQPALPSQVGPIESRDAAVEKDAGGPVSDAFLPPTNAGEAEPHGPLVVSPGIHGVGPAPIRPGDVGDIATQQAEETELAERVLVNHEPATIVATMDESGDVSDAHTTAPARSASKALWVAYAVEQGADRNEVEDLKRDELAERYGPKA